jgi:hypothetical protein
VVRSGLGKRWLASLATLPFTILRIAKTSLLTLTGLWALAFAARAQSPTVSQVLVPDLSNEMYKNSVLYADYSGIKSVLDVSEMAPNDLSLIGEDKLVFDGHQNHPTIEGPKFYKRHGYYCIFAPGGGVLTDCTATRCTRKPF